MNSTTDVIVIGGGVMGTAAAWQLARGGASVRLLERHAIGHALGSSHGPSRIIRLAYDTQDYVQLAKSAYAKWRELEQDAGQTLIQPVGGLDMGTADALGMDGIRAAYIAAGVPFESLDAAALMRRYPQFRLREDVTGLFQADYSILPADRCVATLAAQARRFGALIHEHEPALTVLPTSDGVSVTTPAGTHHAARLVLCAGSWSGALLTQLDIDLPLVVRKEQVIYMEAARPQEFTPGRYPLFIHRMPGSTTLASGFPIYGHSAPKFMIDRVGPVTAPEDTDRSPEPNNLADVRRYAMEMHHGLTGNVSEIVSCRYTMTPDEDFVIDRHPGLPQIVIASPCSGHGFKFGAVIGEALADLALRGATAHDITRFKLDRPALRVAQS